MKNSRKKANLTRIGFLFAILFATMITAAGVSAASYNESDYSRVYDYSYYVKHNTDIPASIRSSRSKALAHFVEHGMAQGRRAIISFNVKAYKKNYPELQRLYGNNYRKYYLHWQRVGYKTRFGQYLLSHYTFCIRINPNGGKYNGKKTIVKVYRHYGTTITLSKPTRAGYTFKGWKLTKGHGTVKGSKFKFTMSVKGTNEISARWTRTIAGRYSGAYKIANYAKTQLGKGGQTYWNYFWVDEWCCMFVTYCANKVGFVSSDATDMSMGSGRFPKTASQRELASVFKAKGQLKLASSGYRPKKGDIIFFVSSGGDKSNPNSYCHTGIVYGTSGSQIITIEGNTGTYNKYTSYVKECTYDPTDSSTYNYSKALRIAAYGIIK